MADRRTIIDVLADLPSCKPPMDHLLELLPRLQPRYYSISSSPKDNPERISITAVLVSYRTRIDRAMKGVATSYLFDITRPLVNDEPMPLSTKVFPEAYSRSEALLSRCRSSCASRSSVFRTSRRRPF